MIIKKYPEKDIQWTVIGLDEYNKIKNKLKDKNKRNLHTNNLKIAEFTNGCWTEHSNRYFKDQKILVVNENYTIKGYRVKVAVASVNKEDSHEAIFALTHVRQRFAELTETTFKRAFGTVEGKYERCVPKQLYWSRKEPYFGLVNSVDFSSHYPASICGLLPDSHTAITKEGTVKPTKEYPFAFYIKSGHIAIYNELDSHNWLFNKQFKMEDLFRLKTIKKPNEEKKVFDDLFNQYITPDDDETVLMKASDYNLTQVYQELYNSRKHSEKAKLDLNASIGQMHRKKYNRDRYAHLAAVAIARANQKMLDLMSKLNIDDIIQIQVDGVIYRGTTNYIGVSQKTLGAPVQEAYRCPCRWDRLGVYMIDLGGDKMKIKSQGYNATTIGILPSESTKFEDMDTWINIKK